MTSWALAGLPGHNRFARHWNMIWQWNEAPQRLKVKLGADMPTIGLVTPLLHGVITVRFEPHVMNYAICANCRVV